MALEKDYELKTLSLGAGLQSSTLAEMIVEGEQPPVDAVIFADTHDEPDHVYQQVDYLRDRLTTVNIPLIVVSTGDMVADIYGGGRFAAMPFFTKTFQEVSGFGVNGQNYQVGRLRRQCTREYKVEPIEKWIRQELLSRGLAKQNKRGAITPKRGVRVCTMLGISWDEIGRIKPSHTKWIDNVWPLIDLRMTRADCVNWLEAHALPIPKKSSCKRCPFHDLPHFREMRDETPDDWREVVLFDQDLRNGKLRLSATAKGHLYMIRDCIPLGEADLTTPEDHGQLDMCDEGYCFI